MISKKYTSSVIIVLKLFKSGKNNWKSEITVAAVYEIRPDDHFLREAVDAETSSFERRVEDVTRISHHVFTFQVRSNLYWTCIGLVYKH